MATVRDRMLPVVERGRQLIQNFGLRQTSVCVRTVQWSGGEVGLGTATTTDVEITPRPKVTDRGNGRIVISKVTPSYSGGGWTPAQLIPEPDTGQDVFLVLVGADGLEHHYRVSDFDSRPNFGYEIEAEALDRPRPDTG